LLPPGLAAAQVRAGKLQAIGVTSSGRSTLVPEMPSLAEAGVPGFQLEIWTAAAAPASMPRHIVTRLSAAISDITRTPEMRQKLFQQGWQVAGTSPEGLANRIKADTTALGGVIAARGIRAE
jgi:tripartite-type tricarboxylate transporter receptor subunit TctC